MVLEPKEGALPKVWWQYLSEKKANEGTSVQSSSIGLAATFTADPLLPHLGGGLIQKGIPAPKFAIAPYNQLYQLCLNPSVTLKQDQLDAIIILWRIEDFLEDQLIEAMAGEVALSALIDEVNSLLDAIGSLRAKFKGTLIVSTPPYPVSLPLFDPHEMAQPTSGVVLYGELLHRWIAGLEDIGGIRILDLHGFLQHAGYADSHDERKWYLYKQPYTETFWSYLGAQLVRIIAAQTISAKKCVVVDCDDTIWGGIVGESGISGIALGEDFPGSAFRDFQKYLLFLANKGIFLAVASKNNREDVFEVFDNLDSMVLSRDDISVFQVHWKSKVDSLQSIASTLNIATSALVFVDDNPKEISEVQERLPEVTCYLVPEEVAYLPGLLKGEGLFDISEITEEDRLRVKMVAAEQQRSKQRGKRTEEEFLSSLELKVDVFEAESRHMVRVTQLVNKTNQFNLTARRRTQDEMEVLNASEDAHVFAMTVSDRFGQYGLVGVAIICRSGDSDWHLDTLLMSCRVLGRNVETAFLAKIAEATQKFGGSTLCGKYLPTRKNSLVEDFYKKHGFAYEASNGCWVAGTGIVKQPPDHVSVSLRLRD